MGASSTFGFGDKDDETYPVYLEQALNGGGQGRKYEVLNMAIPHNDASQILELMRADVLPLQPDIVTFYEGVNNTAVVGTRPLVRLEARSMLVRYLGSVTEMTAPTFGRDDLEVHASERASTFYGDLTQMANLAKSHGIRFIVISQQAKSHLVPVDRIKGVSYEDEYARVLEKLNTDRLTAFELSFAIHHAFMQRLPSWAKEQGVDYVDGIRALDGDRDQLTSWVHLTAQGNRILGGAIADVILTGAGAPAVQEAQRSGS